MGKLQRVDKVLSHIGAASRSELRRMAKQGRILVNGKPIKDSGLQVDPEIDRIELDGIVQRYRAFVYLMLHKPGGVISATEDSRERTVIDLLADEWRVFDLFPVGRLDKDTEGLLLLTNDGQLAHHLLSPRRHVPKTYYAEVIGEVNSTDQQAFKDGVSLDDGYQTMPAELDIVRVEKLPDRIVSSIRLTIHEGKFHQVKRMFEAVGKKVLYLKRISMGPLALDEALPIGEYRELTALELERLKELQP